MVSGHRGVSSHDPWYLSRWRYGSFLRYVGNGIGIPISSTGISSLSPTIYLEKVILIQQLKKNILRVSHVSRDTYCSFTFYPWGFVVKNIRSGKIILVRPRYGDLYQVLSNKEAPSTSLLKNKRGGDLRDNSLGPPLSKVLKTLTPSLHLLSSLYKHLCASCKLGKSCKLLFDCQTSYSQSIF